MATARYFHVESENPANVDAWSTPVMVYAGETFNWSIKQNEASSVIVSPLPGGTWPLDASSYTVTPSSPQSATVDTAIEGTSYDIQCSPASPNAPQILLVAVGVFSPCEDINVQPGQCFAWQNNDNKKIKVEGSGAWPGVHEIDKSGGIVLVYVPTNQAYGTYNLSVTFKEGGASACAQENTPKIIVSGPNEP